MSHLSQKELENIRKALQDQKDRAHTRIDELKAQDPFADPDRLNDNAASDMEASEESNHDRVAALIAELTLQVSDAEAALARMDDGSYGICTNCGEPIDAARLSIMPAATLCMKCEQLRRTE